MSNTKQFLEGLQEEIERRGLQTGMKGVLSAAEKTPDPSREMMPHDDTSERPGFPNQSTGPSEQSQTGDGTDEQATSEGDESGTDSQASHGDSKKPKKEKENERVNKRLQELLHQNKLLQEQMQMVQDQHAQALAATQTHYKQQMERVSTYQSENHELKKFAIEAEREKALAAIQAAREIGDISLEAQALEKLTRVMTASALSTPQEQEGEYFVTPAPPPPAYAPAYQPNVPPMSENFRNWISTRDWAQVGNPNFSERLARQQVEIFNELEDTYRMNGRSDMLDSEEFYDLASKIMDNRWKVDSGSTQSSQPSNHQQQPAQAHQNMGQRPPVHNVAPVSRPGGTMAEQYQALDSKVREYGVPIDPNEYKMWSNTRLLNNDPLTRRSKPYLSTPETIAVLYQQKVNRMRGS